MASGVGLGIRLRFHHHTPEQAAVCLAFHQPATNQLRGNDLRWTEEEGMGQGLGERGGYGRGLGRSQASQAILDLKDCDQKVSKNDWWQPEYLAKTEIEYRNNPELTDTGNDFGSYKLMNQGHSPEECNLTSHNAHKQKTLNALIKDYSSILKRNGNLNICSVADLGCGTGFTTAALKKNFPKAEVTGYDISADAIAFAQRNHKECSFKSCAITSNTSLGKFDLVLAQEFYPFTRTIDLREHKKWLDFIARNLSSSGLCLITVTQKNLLSINSNYKELKEQYNIKLVRVSVPKISETTGYNISRLVSVATHKIFPIATRCIYIFRP